MTHTQRKSECVQRSHRAALWSWNSSIFLWVSVWDSCQKACSESAFLHSAFTGVKLPFLSKVDEHQFQIQFQFQIKQRLTSQHSNMVISYLPFSSSLRHSIQSFSARLHIALRGWLCIPTSKTTKAPTPTNYFLFFNGETVPPTKRWSMTSVCLSESNLMILIFMN